jgi:hypothetical protein
MFARMRWFWRLLARVLAYPPLELFLTAQTRGRYYNYRFRYPDRYLTQSYQLLRRAFIE